VANLSGVKDTGGKFAVGVNYTGGNFATCIAGVVSFSLNYYDICPAQYYECGLFSMIFFILFL
jgi:hypothetical protein